MTKLAVIIGAVVRAILSAFLGKTIKKEEYYRDAKGDTNSDSAFNDRDW